MSDDFNEEEGFSEEEFHDAGDAFANFFESIREAQKELFIKQYKQTAELLHNSNATIRAIHNESSEFLKSVELMKRLESDPEKQMSIAVEFAERIKEMVINWDYHAMAIGLESSGFVVPVDVLKISQDTLEDFPTMEQGDIITCPWCSQPHEVQYSTDTSNGMKTNKMMFFECPEEQKSGIAGLKGRSVMTYYKDQGENTKENKDEEGKD